MKLSENDSCDLLSKCIFDVLIKTFGLQQTEVVCCDLLSKCIFDVLIKTRIKL